MLVKYKTVQAENNISGITFNVNGFSAFTKEPKSSYLAKLLCDANPTEIVLLETQCRNKEETTTAIQWIFDNVTSKLYPGHPKTGPEAYQCGIAYYQGLRNERRSGALICVKNRFPVEFFYGFGSTGLLTKKQDPEARIVTAKYLTKPRILIGVYCRNTTDHPDEVILEEHYSLMAVLGRFIQHHSSLPIAVTGDFNTSCINKAIRHPTSKKFTHTQAIHTDLARMNKREGLAGIRPEEYKKDCKLLYDLATCCLTERQNYKPTCYISPFMCCTNHRQQM